MTEIYTADVDEMTAGALAALEQVRDRLAAYCANTPHLAEAITGIVDEYAAELVEDVTGEDDE